MRQEADEPKRQGPLSSANDLEPVTLEALQAAIMRWREHPKELERLLRALEGDDPDAVPSYRVGSAEGTVLYEGLNGLGEIVDESLQSLYDEVEKEPPPPDDEDIAAVLAALRALGERRRRFRQGV